MVPTLCILLYFFMIIFRQSQIQKKTKTEYNKKMNAFQKKGSNLENKSNNDNRKIVQKQGFSSSPNSHFDDSKHRTKNDNKNSKFPQSVCL